MKLAKVIYHQEDDAWWAESPNDFPSLFIAGDTFEEAKERVWEGLRAMGEAQNLGVLHIVHAPTIPATAPAGSFAPVSTGLRAEGSLVLG